MVRLGMRMSMKNGNRSTQARRGGGKEERTKDVTAEDEIEES